jgi:hypothetical protein
VIELGDIAIMGGGCYGTFYLGQLAAARRKEALRFRRLLVVDHDAGCQAAAHVLEPGCELVVSPWSEFLDGYLVPADRDRDGLTDTIVPTPLMPHLMAHWLERRARVRWPDREVSLVPVDAPLGTPYDRLHRDGVRYVSFADWLCPIHCVEPLLCPAIKAPRTWEMSEAVAAWTRAHARERPTAAPALFSCRHAAFGVGMYPARAAFDGFDGFVPVADTDTGGDLAIGSISSCHGAIALLRVGPARPEPADVLYSRARLSTTHHK